MRLFWSRIESFWNGSRLVACLLVISGIALAGWTAWHPQSPGFSIGLLALGAGIMSIRPKMHPAEKLAWITILVAFTRFEVLAIHRNDRDSHDERERQNGEFRSIAQGLERSLTQSKGQYQDTLMHVNAVLDKTEAVSRLTEQSVGNITGNNSYAVVFPATQPYPTDKHPLIIENHGRQILTGVTVTVYSAGVWMRGTEDAVIDSVDHRLTVGTLHPLERLVLGIRLAPDLIAHNETERQVIVYIAAQNFTVTEYLTLRRSKAGGMVYKYDVFRALSPAEIKALHGNKERPLERAPWSDEHSLNTSKHK